MRINAAKKVENYDKEIWHNTCNPNVMLCVQHIKNFTSNLQRRSLRLLYRIILNVELPIISFRLKKYVSNAV